jgi:steroid delta-isomerase-like uncharacterized protein
MMKREQIVTIMQAMQRAWNARDPVALAAAHADDALVESPMFGEVRGHSEIERSYRDLFRAFADWTLEGQDLIIDGNHVAQMFTVEATHTSELFGVEATHRRFKIQGVLIYDFRDGKVVHERRLYDFTGLLLQVGVLKAKPGK